MHFPSSRRRAFSLVELLVVVGVVAVLVAVLMPVLGKARAHADRVKCAANLRSMGQALTMYVQQTGYYPCWRITDLTKPGKHFAVWPTRLRLFMGGDQSAFYCPSSDERCRWRTDGRAPPGHWGAKAEARHVGFGYDLREYMLQIDGAGMYFSYGYNAWGARGGSGYGLSDQLGLGDWVNLNAPRGTDWTSGELRAGRVRSASEMIAIADAAVDGNIDYAVQPDPRSPFMLPGTTHGGGANVLYCDGHVSWHPQRDLVLTGDNRRDLARARLWDNTNQPPETMTRR